MRPRKAVSRADNFVHGGLPVSSPSSLSNFKVYFVSSMTREMALVAYRNLLRSARIAFQGTTPDCTQQKQKLTVVQET